jgi:RND family efflux transporter MFP subunit
MSALHEMLSWPAVQRLGWIVVSFLWQGTVVAAALAVALLALRRASANTRYVAACAALALMVACPLATWGWLAAQQPVGADRRPIASPSFPVAVAEAQPVSSADSVAHDDAESQHPSPLAAASTEANRADQTNIAPVPFHLQQTQWISLLAIGWIVGVFVLSLRLVIGARRVWQLRRQATRLPAGQLQNTLARLVEYFHISWPVELAESALVEVPTVIGWLKPMVLLPATAISGLTIEQLEALLAHEIAHICRHDYLVNLVQTAIETLLFYHPAVWWVSSCIRQEREHCCDDMAVAVCGNRLAYARSLMTLEELRVAVGPWALAAGGGRLLPRIRRIVGAPAAARCAAGYWLAGVLLLALSAAIVAQLTHSAQAAGDNPPKTGADRTAKTQTDDTTKKSENAKSDQGTAATDVANKPVEDDGTKSSKAADPTKLPVVEVVHPVEREVYDFQDYTGQVVPAQRVELRARVSGQLAAANVKAGDLVKQGDLLFRIDDQRYKAELDKAQANLELVEGPLKQVQSELDTLNRGFSQNSNPNEADRAGAKQLLDRVNARKDEATARVNAAQAELQLARLNLAATQIIAPINGRIGKIELDAGNMVKADDTVLASISSVDPMELGFWMDQNTLVRLQAAQRAGKFKFADTPVQFQIGTEEKDFPFKAKLVGGAFEVDSKTGGSLLRAIAPNSDEALIPGMWVKVRLKTSEPYPGLVVPETALIGGRNIDHPAVLVVNAQGIIQRQDVKLGPTNDGLTAIKSGLTKDDLVIREHPFMQAGYKVEPRLITLPTESSKTP